MAFSDEIRKLARTLRCHVRFQTGTGSENPGASGVFTDRRWGKEADNTGAVPIKGTVLKFGTFARALTNADQGFETPSITSEMLDRDNEWRALAAQPWVILNRLFYYVLRVRDDSGAYLDSDVVWGQLTLPEFSAGAKARITVQMVPDYLGKTVPKRTINLTDWPHADSNALGKAVPIIYGKMDNTVGNITGLAATRIDPSGYVAPTLSAALTTGGNAPYGVAKYYALCALDAIGNPASPLSNIVGPFTFDATNSALDLSWVAGGPLPPYWRLFRGNSPDFGQMDMYREGDWHFPGLIDGTTLAVTDEWTGIDSREQGDPDTHWDLLYRQQVFYYLSAVSGLEEQPAVGPVAVYLAPLNGGGAINVTWDAIDATSLILRRQRQAYSFDPFYDRQWDLAPSATSFLDLLNDNSPVNVPEGFGKPRGGAVEALYVDTNPVGGAGQFKYVVAGHGCKEIREVYVTKSIVTQTGGSSGSINRPSGLTLTKVGATGSTVYRYVVTAVNSNGETTHSSEVRRSDGPNPLTGSDYNDLAWGPVSGASSYRVYRGGDAEDLGLLGTATTEAFRDDGSFALDTSAHPPENNTTGTAFSSGSESSPAQPILQTKNVDYFVETETINGNVYQILRFNPSQEGNPVTANVWGIETLGTATGNGDGGTLIENIVDQFKHFLYNWVFNSYASGAWFTTTSFHPGLLDDASFDAASAVAAARILGGYRGAGALLEETDVRQAIQDWLTSADLDWYLWNGAFKVRMFDPTVVDRNALPQYTPKASIFRESFEPALDVSRHWNKIEWQAGPQYDGYYISGSQQADDSIDLYGRTIDAPIRTLWWTRHLATANDIVARALRLSKHPPIYATWVTPLRALNDEIASLIAVTHPEGIEIGSQGWTKRVCKILQSDIDLDRCVVSLRVLDVDALIGFLGYVRYGDRTWVAADLSYTTAIASGKTSTYGYLADRVTGRFSNGALAKKYWSR